MPATNDRDDGSARASHARSESVGAPLDATTAIVGQTPRTRDVVDAIAAAPAPDRAFGPYLVLAEIARGGMGAVYRVRDTRLGRDVALKIIRSGALALPEEVERFTREARAVAQLTHPHIVRLYDVGAHNGYHFFTMELAAGSLAGSGESLHTDCRKAVALLAKVARALAHVHASGLLHRDLKPANILLREDHEPLISDFGLAKSANAAFELTASGAVVGTPAYMAPEQAAGDTDRLSAAVDVWSLGVIAYELICGARPFQHRDRARLRAAIQLETPVRPRRHCRHLDRDLETIILKCLEKQPSQRYASAAALADDLEAWLAGQPIQARPPGPLRRLLRWSRRHALAVAGACAMLAVGLVLAVARPWVDPEAPLHDMEADLVAGRPVTWLDEHASPPWSEALSPVTLSASDDGSFRMTTDKSGLLLLLRDPMVADYTLVADVRLDSFPKGQAGVFVCRTRHDAADGKLDGVIVAALSAGLGPAAGKLAPQLMPALSVPASARMAWHSRVVSPPSTIPQSASGWHRVSIRVHSELIRMTVDGTTVCELTKEKRLAAAQKLLMGRTDVSALAFPAYPVRGGLGLFVGDGPASFRHVTVTPIPKTEP